MACTLQKRSGAATFTAATAVAAKCGCRSQHAPASTHQASAVNTDSSSHPPPPRPSPSTASLCAQPTPQGTQRQQHVRKHSRYTLMRACTQNPNNRLYSSTCRASHDPAPTLLEHSQQRSDRARLIILLQRCQLCFHLGLQLRCGLLLGELLVQLRCCCDLCFDSVCTLGPCCCALDHCCALGQCCCARGRCCAPRPCCYAAGSCCCALGWCCALGQCCACTQLHAISNCAGPCELPQRCARAVYQLVIECCCCCCCCCCWGMLARVALPPQLQREGRSAAA